MLKKCTICKIEKQTTYFNKDKSRWDCLTASCKDCSKIIRKRHYDNNKEETLKQNKEWKLNNKEKYRTKERESERERTNSDINFKLRKRIRTRLRDAIKNGYKSGSAIRDLGCTINELKIHLESSFQHGMNWDNYGFYGWHIDHIIPLSKFKLENREELLKACHYTNLQPLWSEDNFKKGNK